MSAVDHARINELLTKPTHNKEGKKGPKKKRTARPYTLKPTSPISELTDYMDIAHKADAAIHMAEKDLENTIQQRNEMVYQLIDAGLTQTDVAYIFRKSKTWVSLLLKARKESQ